MPGYHGHYLLYDLTDGSRQSAPLAASEARAFLGGPGLAVRWLLRHSASGVEPLGPENPLVLASCPLVDTGVTTTARAAFAARSPLTGFLGESLLSSHFAIALKRSGWDGFVLTGRCPELSVLVVDGDRIEVLPVPDLAGVSAPEAEASVRRRLGSGFQVAVIGPAGENRVRYATVGHAGRQAGRTGMGAVMGSKNLKAIALRGTQRHEPSDPAALARIARRLQQRSRGPETAKYRLVGTSANLLTFDRLGILPSRNFSGAEFPAAHRLTGEALATGHTRERSGCAACTIGCEHRFVPVDGQGSARGEYESLFALGPLLGLEDPDAVLRALRSCDELGMDTLSFGGTLAWALESRERGVLDDDLLGGLDLRFGDPAAVLQAVELAAHREGPLGDLLAEGARRAALRLGRGSEAWALHVKGLELPGYEPRALKSLALGLAVGSRGACHNRSSAYDSDLTSERERSAQEIAADAVESEDRAAVLDALVLCKFLRRCFDDFYPEAAELLGAVTGWDVTGEELRAAGGRIVSLKRLYNQREGATRADDTLPPRLLEEPIPGGPRQGTRLPREELDHLLDAYYALRQWTPTGTLPTTAVGELLGASEDGTLILTD